MVVTQATATDEVDPVDLLVPPPRSRGRMLLVALVVVAALTGTGFLAPSGVVFPRIGVNGAGGVTWSEAHGRSGPRLSFIVRNNGWFQTTITGIADRVAGLGDPSYLFTRASSASGPTSASAGGEALLPAHASLEITLRFGAVDCDKLSTDRTTAVSIRARDVLGLPVTVDVVPLVFLPSASGGPTPMNSRGVGWPVGLTWTACHPGAEPLAVASFG